MNYDREGCGHVGYARISALDSCYDTETEPAVTSYEFESALSRNRGVELQIINYFNERLIQQLLAKVHYR